jgi:hypothetical protein
VFILAGGVVREVKGQVGIHRPALSELPTKTDMKSVKQAADEMAKESRAYAAEMNVSERLVDDMLVVPPESMRWLSNNDLAGYGIGSRDPVFAESLVLEGAKKYSIPPTEFRQREARAAAVCKSSTLDGTFGTPGKRSDCAEAILSGRN